MSRISVLTCLALALAAGATAQKRPFDVETLLRIRRISEPALSPDGKTVAFTVTTPDLEGNSRPKQIWTVPVSGGAPRQITHEGTDNERPRWSPDSKQIYFVSNRGGSSQIWAMDADGGHPRQITRVSTEANGLLVSPDGMKIVFLSSVYPECGPASSAGDTPLFDDACNKRNLEADAHAPSKARIYTSLLYRHWTEWQTRRRQHVLVASITGNDVRDLTPGKFDVPPFSLGGPDGYAISPDSTELAYVVNTDPDPSISTNSDIYTVPLTGGEAKKITANPAADDSPLYSPDGRFIAYRAQQRPGYESDRWRLMVFERATEKMTNLTESLDRWVGSFTWSPDSTRIFFTMEDRGRTSLQMIAATGGGLRSIISGASTLEDVQFTSDGRTMIYTEESGSRPLEIFRAMSGGGTGVALTHLNDALLAGAALTPLEEMWVDSEDKSRIQVFITKPPDFTPARKYPVVFMIHGGPQGAWGESWTYRWNSQVFASAGYVVVQPNPRGSTGYGQKFIDEINGDWGGKPFDDLMAVADSIAAQPYVDANRMVAAGASFGGYMVNWINGHTNRFKAIVSHAGVFDAASWARETEEQWFPIWEFKGTPADNPDLYTKFSPSTYIKDFKTPTLVIHGELDFRDVTGQGIQLFTALQQQKVPSKLVIFPDEGHWILKPQNSLLWYHTVLEWIGEWVGKP
jgi:dipeptidyl aminopeptidase/acylaminoacyl peptidase